MTPAMRVKIALTIEPIIAKQAKERMEEGKNQYTSPQDKCPEGKTETTATNNTPEKNAKKIKPKRDTQVERQNTTNYQVAQIAQVSDKTVQRYKKIQEKASDEIKAKVDSGEISINQGYQQVKLADKENRQEERRVENTEKIEKLAQ